MKIKLFYMPISNGDDVVTEEEGGRVFSREFEIPDGSTVEEILGTVSAQCIAPCADDGSVTSAGSYVETGFLENGGKYAICSADIRATINALKVS